ncbi:MAG: BamA/TamA family outer membrane protein [Gemmatimonadetes bacterium]|nr:BamA/TamA family outer membrane protein [Gemmatimonadota bacterium]
MQYRSSLKLLFPLAPLLAGILLPATSEAQYFGRNKVQYEDFDFQVLETEHFDIHYYEEEEQAARIAGQMAERWYARISRLLDHELRGRQPIILYASHPHFEQTNAIFGTIGEGTGGVTEVFKRRIVLPFQGPLRETDHVLGHELVHAFQFDITGSGRVGLTAGIPSALAMPLWFIEGMAEYLSVGPVDPHSAMWMRDATVNTLPTIEQLSNPRYFPYRYGQALWSFMAGWYGDEVVGRVLKASRTSRDAYQALYKVIGEGVNTLSDRWHAAVRQNNEWIIENTDSASVYGNRILSGESGSGNINIAPALSPDGRKIAFLSEKDLFSIELYVADAETGEILRRLTRTVVDPHLESLGFINSAGTWSPDSRFFALGTVTEGNPGLTIIDTETGETVNEIEFSELGEIFNPSWSPDGGSIAFSALVRGFSDIFIYDLETEELNRITDDIFADLQPAWSPDGSKIAFATDRFGSDAATLRLSNYRIGLIDASTGFITELPSFPQGKNVNPQWSPDGNTVFFISDRDGIANIYRFELGSPEIRQVTNVLTGITGITRLSPALSVAQVSGRAAFSVYEDNGYNIYSTDSPEILEGQALNEDFTWERVATLPPDDRITDDVVALLSDATTGLADQSGFAEVPYTPNLSLDYVAQPYLVAGADRFGSFIGGGAALFWSDMLGTRNLATALQVNGSFKDISGAIAYENRRSRWNRGALIQQNVFSTGFISQSIGTDGAGNLLFVEDVTKLRQTNRDITGFTSYALNRSHRLEFSLGVRNIAFSAEVERRIFDEIGNQLSKQTETLPSAESIYLAQGSVAVVYDNSIFGLTAPILGQRYRLEATPLVGSISYVSVLADYRKYVMPVRPFTLAGRILHFGRYGPGSDDTRLRDQYLGFPGLVRGYDFNSFTVSDCDLITGTCPVLDRLFGSRIMVANLELRFPLLGAFSGGSSFYGALPIDLTIFGDAGLAWHRDLTGLTTDPRNLVNEQAFFLGGDREPVYSAGAGLRVNVFGFVIFEIDRVRAFQRRKWLWQFSFVPGF